MRIRAPAFARACRQYRSVLPARVCMRHFLDEHRRPNPPSCRSQKVGIIKCKSRADRSKPVGLLVRPPATCSRLAFGLWSVRFPPVLVRTGRRLPVQALGERRVLVSVTGYPRRGPGTGLKLWHQSYQKSKRNLVYGIWSQ